MAERSGEEFPLASRRDAGNEDDYPSVQGFLSVESEEIGAIVCDERVVVPTDYAHELPVFGTAETKIVYVIGGMTSRMHQFDQRRMQAFIDQKLHG